MIVRTERVFTALESESESLESVIDDDIVALCYQSV